VNKIQVLLNNRQKEFVIPLESCWDIYGQQDGIEQYQASVLEEILNNDQDFEVSRFEHNPYDTPTSEATSIHYEFYLYNSSLINTTSTIPSISGTWENSYTSKFTDNEIYFQRANFKKSFWKLDLYDRPTAIGQQNYITIILPTHQGLTQLRQISLFQTVQIKKPKYVLDYIGDKEGFFIYWLKKRNYLNIDTFYMSAKFFNADIGQFIRMMNTPQTMLANTSNPYTFNQEDYFYYRVKLNYLTQKYEVFGFPNNVRVGIESQPIKWYEYVNP